MLTIKELNVRYTDKIVLDHLSLSLSSGEIHGLVGLNGSGKTTLLNSIFGFVKKEGEVCFNGLPLDKKEVAYLETENFFYSDITGKDYLNLFAYYNPGSDIEQLNKLFDLPLDHFIQTYSTGMRKKLAIMAVLILNKKIILLDEPFNGIDIEGSFILSKVLVKLRESAKLIVVTSHVVDTLTNICDQIHLLQDGSILKSYSKTEFDALEDYMEQYLHSRFTDLVGNVMEEL